MRRLRVVSVVFVMLIAAACARATDTAPAQPGPSATIDDTLTIPLGKQASTRDGAVRLTFVRLVSESRCPINVVCVWQGDAAVRLHGIATAGAVEVTVHTALDPKTFSVNGYTVTLLDVLPYPGSAASESRAVVRVMRISE